MTGSFLLPGTIIGYIVAIVFAALYTIYRSPAAHRSASILFVLTWALHTATLVREALALGRLPLASGPEYLLSLGWIVLSLHLVLWFRMHVEIAGVVLPPLAGAMTFAGNSAMRSAVASVLRLKRLNIERNPPVFFPRYPFAPQFPLFRHIAQT